MPGDQDATGTAKRTKTMRTRRQAWRAVGCLGLAVIVMPVLCWLVLCAALLVPLRMTQLFAVCIVGEYKIYSAVPAMVPLIMNPDVPETPVAEEAVPILGETRDPQYVPVLIHVLRRQYGYTMSYGAVESLVQIDTPGSIAPLVAVATDPFCSEVSHRLARHTIAKITRAPELREFVHDPGPYRDPKHVAVDMKYTETQQQELLRKWWATNKHKYPGK